MLRFHSDEDINYAPLIAECLRQRGIDITTSPEERLLGASDEEQLAFATREGRVLLTHNIKDFAVLHRQDSRHAGIIYIQQRRFSIGDMIRGLAQYWERFEPNDLAGKFDYLQLQ